MRILGYEYEGTRVPIPEHKGTPVPTPAYRGTRVPTPEYEGTRVYLRTYPSVTKNNKIWYYLGIPEFLP